MDLKQLRYFVTIAEEGSFTAAARKLYLTQPPLSASMGRLEQELNCTLLDRGARQVFLTEPGRILYRRAKDLLGLADSIKEEVLSQTGTLPAILSLGIVSSLIDSPTGKKIPAFLSSHPGVRLDVSEGNTYELLEQLRLGNIQAAILRTPYTAPSFTSLSLCSDSLVAVGKKKFFSAVDSTSVSRGTLSKLPLIGYRRWSSLVEDWFQEENLSPHWICINDDARTTIFYANEGLGVALVPNSACALASKNLLVKPIRPKSVKSTICLVYPPSLPLSSTMKEFLSWMTT